jgi:murein L,D-transpeptidase YafK
MTPSDFRSLRPCELQRRRMILSALGGLTALAYPRSILAAGGPAPPDWEKYATPKADKVIVYKGLRRMELCRTGTVLRTYHIALGRHPFGQKMEEGDGRTPEGRYTIDRRNMMSEYHLALHISYPDRNDLRRAAAQGVPAGGSIMIHGQPNYLTQADRLKLNKDWTAGCIALTNPEIDEVWRLTDNGVAVDILP